MALYSDLIFPEDIAWGSESRPRFSTVVLVSNDGKEKRVSRWNHPLWEYNVAIGVKSLQQLHELRTIFRIAEGRRHTFLFKDPFDYTSTIPTREQQRIFDATGPYDQIIATGDNVTSEFTLKKNYTVGGQTYTRNIPFPIASTIQIAVADLNGDPLSVDCGIYPDSAVTYNSETRKVELGQRACVTFTPVESPNVLSVQSVGWNPTSQRQQAIISWANYEFTNDSPEVPFCVGDLLVASGYPDVPPSLPGLLNPIINNWTASDNIVITELLTNSFRVEQLGSTFSSGSIAQSGGYDQEITICTAGGVNGGGPSELQTVTAGYEFYVPVRFDTDRLSNIMEDYGLGSGLDVRLIEVRDYAENGYT